MYNRILATTAVVLFLLTSLAIGGYGPTGESAQKLSSNSFNQLGLQSNADEAVLEAVAPETAASYPGTELATYTDQTPPENHLGKLMPLDIMNSPPTYLYYGGSYVGWPDFKSIFPQGSAGLWIERAHGWSWYVTLPQGAWTRELLYVPMPSQVTMYEIYPPGYVMSYNFGYAQPGYYYIWFYADTLGRHRNVFATNGEYSNTAIIDVYSMTVPPNPIPPGPSPKEQCEQNPVCDWYNGQCHCRGFDPDSLEKIKCLQNPVCSWYNGHCYCKGFNPDNPEKEQCEQNPTCSWTNGHCYCKGFNPDRGPGPVPTPPPVPTPTTDTCEDNPSCHLVDGNCLCTGFGTGDDSMDMIGTGFKTTTDQTAELTQ